MKPELSELLNNLWRCMIIAVTTILSYVSTDDYYNTGKSAN